MASNLICLKCKNPNEAVEVTQMRCGHIVCWICLEEHVKKNLDCKIRCPIDSCPKFVADRDIRSVLCDEMIANYEQLTLRSIQKRVECILDGCQYFFICNETDVQFDCPKCSLFNCNMCKAAHRHLTCAQYRSVEEAQAMCQDEIKRAKAHLNKHKKNINREMLEEMDEQDLLIHGELLECSTCCRSLARGDVVILRCSHSYCRFCLVTHINNSSSIPILCPSDKCKKSMEEREIIALLDAKDLVIYIDRCNSSIKGKIDLFFQCQKPDCPYFVIYSTKPNTVTCPLCESINCTKCFAIHTNETCEQFKERIKSTSYGKTLLEIEEKIRRKELMRCIKCNQILQKISGCSWIQCSNCKFEMCWALQMRRWGPKGRGDESDGCKCQLLGPRCHPECESCEPHHDDNELGGDFVDLNLHLRHFFNLLFLVRFAPRPEQQ